MDGGRVMATTSGRVEHGTLSRYAKGCRCDDCKGANRERTRAWRRAHATVDTQAIPHGASGYTNYGCRCETCTDGHRVRCNDYRSTRRAAKAA